MNQVQLTLLNKSFLFGTNNSIASRDIIILTLFTSVVIHFFIIASLDVKPLLIPKPVPFDIIEIANSIPQKMSTIEQNSNITKSSKTNSDTKRDQNIIKENKDNITTRKSDNEIPTAKQLFERSIAYAANYKESKGVADNVTEIKRKFISRNTKDIKYAAYMEAWRAKVERIGNLNYPGAVGDNNLSGTLLLEVAIDKKGKVVEIIIKRPSGKKLLDRAAIDIVNLAAPYSPFPESIASETDIIHIARTWKFVDKLNVNER